VNKIHADTKTISGSSATLQWKSLKSTLLFLPESRYRQGFAARLQPAGKFKEPQ
jgi:hypothetical protein